MTLEELDTRYAGAGAGVGTDHARRRQGAANAARNHSPLGEGRTRRRSRRSGSVSSIRSPYSGDCLYRGADIRGFCAIASSRLCGAGGKSRSPQDGDIHSYNQ